MQSDTQEIWKDVVGYEGRYMVSSVGRVKSLAGKFGKRVYKERLLRAHINSTGYPELELSRDGVQIAVSPHRLVAFAFIPNPQNKPEVNHINGIKTDNRVENLEWCTRGENIAHCYRMGLRKSAKSMTGKFNELNPNSRPVVQLTPDGEVVKAWPSMAEAVRNGFAHTMIYTSMREGKLYKNSNWARQ